MRPRRLAGEDVPGICLRSARDRVKYLSRSPETTLGGEAVEPLAFRVGEEPDGNGRLLRGAPPRGFSQTKVFEKL
jgi:hypothetical protein